MGNDEVFLGTINEMGMRKESLDLSKRTLNSKRRQQMASFSLLVYSHPVSTHWIVIPESRDEISGISPSSVILNYACCVLDSDT